MLTIGVLGANGFIGSRIVEKLHLEGSARVVPIVRSYRSLARVSRFDLDSRIADALDGPALAKAFAGCDVVVNAVLGSHHQIVAEPPIIYGAAEAAGVRRLVQISTASVHGQDPEPGTNESSPLHTRHAFPYNNAKVKAERQFQALRRRGRVELVMLRPGIVFGPRDIWITGIAHALAHGEAYVVNGGNGICNSIYVDNLVHAVALALTADVDREVFLVGDEETITWIDLYRWVAAALKNCPPVQMVDHPEIVQPRLPLLDRLRGSPVLRALFRAVPRSAKILAHRQIRLLRGIRAGLRDSANEQRRSDWAPRENRIVEVPLEIADLHCCRYKLPFDKARKRLGYVPPVALGDGLLRTIRALRFAGYPVDAQFAGLSRAPRMARVDQEQPASPVSALLNLGESPPKASPA